MATPEELVARLRLDLGDPRLPNEGSAPDSDSLWSDAELYSYLNDAQNEFARKTLCFPDATSFTSTVTADDPWVTIDERVLKVRRGYLNTAGGEVTPIKRGELEKQTRFDDYGSSGMSNWRTVSGTPCYAVTDLEAKKVRLVPYSTADDSISWETYRYPKEPIEDDMCDFEIDERWHTLLLIYAQHMAYRKQDTETVDMARSNDLLTLWELKMEEPVAEYTKMYRPAGVTTSGWIW